METKICTGPCGLEKELKFFNKRALNADGYLHMCKECSREYHNKYHTDNKDQCNAYQKKHYENNKESIKITHALYKANNKDHIAKKASEYHFKNRDKINTRHSERYLDNIEEEREKRRGWAKRNPEAATRLNARSRDKLIAATPENADFKKMAEFVAERNRLNAEAGYVKYHVDHILPLSRGGANDENNLQVMLAVDNLRKQSKTQEEWEQVR